MAKLLAISRIGNGNRLQQYQNLPSMQPPLNEQNNLFPVFLKLEQMRLLIVGGGNIGLEKLLTVIHNSPSTKVTLVAVEIKEEIKEFASNLNNIKLVERPFEISDLKFADLVMVAIDDHKTSEEICRQAKQQKKLVNAADKPGLCDFYLGSIVTKGSLKIAISTNGKSPTAAKRLKEVLTDALPEELDDLINNLSEIRKQLHGDFADKVKQLNTITRSLVE